MIGSIIISVFVLALVLFVYREYKNEKKYQEERHQRRQDVKKEEKKPVRKPSKVPSAKELEAKKEQEKKAEQKKRLEEKRLEEKRLEEKRLKEKRLEEKKPEPELIPEPVVTEIKKETVEVIEKPKSIPITLANYPKFDHSRLIEMGLSQEEAKEFVKELIPQIGTHIPLIKEAMDGSDFHSMEQLTHSIKGSSTTVGTGGVSDLLVDYNTYLKTGKELAIAEAYFEHLNHYYEELKEQYS